MTSIFRTTKGTSRQSGNANCDGPKHQPGAMQAAAYEGAICAARADRMISVLPVRGVLPRLRERCARGGKPVLPVCAILKRRSEKCPAARLGERNGRQRQCGTDGGMHEARHWSSLLEMNDRGEDVTAAHSFQDWRPSFADETLRWAAIRRTHDSLPRTSCAAPNCLHSGSVMRLLPWRKRLRFTSIRPLDWLRFAPEVATWRQDWDSSSPKKTFCRRVGL